MRPLNGLKPFLKRKVSQIIMTCVFRHGIVENAFRSKGLDPKTLKWPRVIRHALLSKYGLFIAQDSFVSRKPGRISWDLLLSPTFPETHFKVKCHHSAFRCTSFNREVRRMRSPTNTFPVPHRISIKLFRSETDQNPTRLVLKPGFPRVPS